jgi:hypothetical protein
MLGQELHAQHITGELLIADGVLLLLDIGKPVGSDIDAYIAYLKGDGPAVERHDDIDAYFKGDAAALRKAITSIARREGLPDDWVRGAIQELFYAQSAQQHWLEYPGLRIYLAPPDYVLAMKIATAHDYQNIEDSKILIEKLHISTIQDLIALVKKYIPEQLLTSGMHTTIEQAFTS